MERKLLCGLLLLSLLLTGLSTGAWAEMAPTDTPNEHQAVDPDWGITLSVQNLTPNGMTLVVTQAGGSVLGELEYGSEFHVEVYQNDVWEPVPYIKSVAFTMAAYLLEQNENWKMNIHWDDMYGPLSPGRYRLVKEFTDFHEDGYENALFYAEFIITESHDCRSEDGDMICDTCLSLVEHRSKDENNDGRCDLCGIWDEYRVVGSTDWLGNWDPAFEDGRMVRQEDGTYKLIFEDVIPGYYEIKVTKNGTWEESWGYQGENFYFTVSEQTDVFVTFTLQGGVDPIRVEGRAIPLLKEEEGEKSADTHDQSLLPVLLLLAALPVAHFVLGRKKYF